MKPSRHTLLSTVVMVTALSLTACSETPPTPDGRAAELKAATLEAAYDPASSLTITTRQIEDLKAVTGRYVTSDEATARARSGGTMVRLLVDEGDVIQAGALIGVVSEPRMNAEIAARQAGARAAEASAMAMQGGSAAAQVDIARARAIAAQAPATLEQARAAQARAQADYDRTQTLYQQGVYAQARLDQMNAARRVADAQVKAAQAGVAAAGEVVRAAQVQASVVQANARAAQFQAGAARAQTGIATAMQAEGRILAPRSGRVTSVPVTVGSVVMPGEVVATIAGGVAVLRILVPEADMQNIKAGQNLALTDETGAVTGRAGVIKIYPLVTDGQITLDLVADGPQERFIGQRTSVLFPVGTRQAVSIPSDYVRTHAGVDYARLLRDKRVLEVPLQLAPPQQGRVEVLSGLVPGDVIVAYAAPKAIPTALPVQSDQP